MAKIICIGSSSKDIFFPTDRGIIIDTPEELTSQKKIAFELGAKYQVEERYESLGGCAANVAAGLAKLGIDVRCRTEIGDDMVGSWIERQFNQANVGTDLIHKQIGCKSDLSAIIVDKDSGEHIVFSDRDANEKLEIIPENLSDAQWIFVSSLNGNCQAHLKKIAAISKDNSICIAFNPGQKNIATNPELVALFAKNSKIIFINKDEALEIVKSFDSEVAAEQLEDEKYLLQMLKENGSEVVVITDGEKGAWAYAGAAVLYSPAILQKAVDSTGAGDAFTSGFLAAYLKEKNLTECLQWGIANSSNSVTEYGGQKGLLNEKEICEIVGNVTVESVSDLQ